MTSHSLNFKKEFGNSQEKHATQTVIFERRIEFLCSKLDFKIPKLSSKNGVNEK